jgi:DivIVA domain-containing protein
LHWYFVAWAFIAAGMLLAARDVIKLTAGRLRPQTARPAARRDPWSDLRPSLTIAACGFWLLAAVDHWTSAFLWLAYALYLAFMGWGVIANRRSRGAAKANGAAGGTASGRDARVTGEQPNPGWLGFPALTASAAEVAAWVDRTTFATTRLRPGYVQQEVDVFLDTIRDAFLGVKATALTSDEVRTVTFATTRLRPGYDEEDVDNFLDYVQERLSA